MMNRLSYESMLMRVKHRRRILSLNGEHLGYIVTLFRL